MHSIPAVRNDCVVGSGTELARIFPPPPQGLATFGHVVPLCTSLDTESYQLPYSTVHWPDQRACASNTGSGPGLNSLQAAIVAVGVVLGLAAVAAYALTLKRARDKAHKLKKGAQDGSATTVSSGSVSQSSGSGEPNTQQSSLQVVVEPQASQAADPWQAIMRRSAARQHTTGACMHRVGRDALPFIISSPYC